MLPFQYQNMFNRGLGGFDATKLKASLMLANSRFDVAKNKKTALMKQNMREVANLLAEEPPQEEKARIRTERLIKDDFRIEAYEILQLECQLLIERVQLLKHTQGDSCPTDLVSCVSDLIYAAPRVEITELREIKRQLIAKFGRGFAMDADKNKDGVVSERIVEKLSLAPPTAYLVQNYMINIAKLYGVTYEPVIQLTFEEAFEPVAAPVGYSVPVAKGTGLGQGGVVQQPPIATTSTFEQEVSSGMPPTNPDFKKGPATVVEAFAYAPEDAMVPSTNPAVSSPSPTVLKVNAIANHTHAVQTGLSVTTGEEEQKELPKAKTGADGGVHDKQTQEDPEPLAKNTDTVQTRPSAVSSEEEKEVAPKEGNKNLDAAADEKVCYKDTQEDISPAKETPPHARQQKDKPASEEETMIPENKMELHDVLTGLSVPVNKKQEQEDVPKEEEEPKPISSSASQDLCEVTAANKETQDKIDAHTWINVTPPSLSPPSLSPPSSPPSTTNPAPVVSSSLELLRNRFQALSTTPAVEETNNKKNLDDTSTRAALDGSVADEVMDNIKNPNSNDGVVMVDQDEKQEVNRPEDGLLNEEKSNDNETVVEPEVPSQKKDNNGFVEQITGAALAGGALGFVVAGSFGGILGAAGIAHLAAKNKKRGGKAADMARQCGDKVSSMSNKLVETIEEA